MTDNDIIKAKELLQKLEEAYNAYYDTSKSMPYDIDTTIRETAICLEHSIDLINRQKAEIERLSKVRCHFPNDNYCKVEEVNEENQVLKEENKRLIFDLEIIKAEAITEFEERLKKDISNHRTEMFMNGLKGTPRTQEITYECVEEYIDQIAKELKGEQ